MSTASLISATYPSKHARPASAADDRLLQVTDFGLAAIVFLVPFLLGARQHWGQLVFVILCSVVATAWCARQIICQRDLWVHTSTFFIALGAIFLVALQLIPLPDNLLRILAPYRPELLPLWVANSDASFHLGNWQTLSVSPSATRIALALVMSYGLLFVVVVQRLRTVDDITKLIRLIAWSTILMAVFGLIQYFFSNGLFLWFYEYPYTDTHTHVKGAFTSRNHFASFMALGVGPILACILLHQQREQMPGPRVQSKRTFESTAKSTSTPVFKVTDLRMLLLSIGLITVVSSTLLSLSRGGIVAMAIAISLAVAAFFWLRLARGNHFLGAVSIGACVLLLLSCYGYGSVAERINGLQISDLEELDHNGSRRKVWSANVAAFSANWRTGSGAGTHRQICPVYLSESNPKEFTHAENSYLQIATENGLPGCILLALAMIACLYWCIKVLRSSALGTEKTICVGVAAGLAASAAHAGVDFAWYLPACMAITVSLAACALRLAQLTTDEQSSYAIGLSRPTWIGITLIVILASTFAIATLFGPARASLEWNKYRLAQIASSKLYSQAVLNSEEDAHVRAEMAETLNQSMAKHLRRVVQWHPEFAWAHRKLAKRYLIEFNTRQRKSANAMDVFQIRDAAASGFASAQALKEWLTVAFGDNSKLLYMSHYHARKAAQLSPLEGESYLTLATLCFLEGRTTDGAKQYVDQALRVRPTDGDVAFDAGNQYLSMAEPATALAHWIKIFPVNGKHQEKIVAYACKHMSAATFLQLFQPDWRTLDIIGREYEGRVDQYAAVVEYAAKAAATETSNFTPHTAANVWFSLAQMQSNLDQTDAAVVSLKQGYRFDPHNFKLRHFLGTRLLRNNALEEARNHLRWCVAQQPDNANIRSQLNRCLAMQRQHNTAPTLRY